MRIILRTISIFSWLAASAIAGAADMDSRPVSPVPPLRIMPLGDSITDGYLSSLAGYRYRLYQLMTNAGFTVDFVGTQKDNGTPGLPDWDHEGHCGWLIDGIDQGFPVWVKTIADPDIILLLIGTNDYGKAGGTNAINRLDHLITTITATRPRAKLIVANLLHRHDGWDAAIQTSFNPFVPGLVARHAALGQQVYFLDLCSALGLADLQDGLHPNQAGYDKIAAAWFGAINKVAPPPGSPILTRIPKKGL